MNKTEKILALSKKGFDAKAIAKKVDCSNNYVYHVRWAAKQKPVKRGRSERVLRAVRTPAGKAALVKAGLSKRNVNRLVKAIGILQQLAA